MTAPSSLSLEFSRVFLQNPVSCRLFSSFLESEFNHENLLFWLDVENFKHINDEKKLLQTAKEIYSKYITSGAEYAVNLGFNVIESIQEKMAKMQLHGLFDEAQENIFQLMRMDPYPRFIRSDAYVELLRGHADEKHRHPLEEMVLEGFSQVAESQDGWDEIKEQEGVIISKKKFGDIYCMRGIGIVDAAPSTVFDLINDISKRKLWDDLYCGGHEVERLNDSMVVFYLSWNSPSKLAFNRDFVVLRVTRTNKDDGSYLSVSKSVSHPNVPPRQGFVRGEMESSGFVIRPCGPTQSLVVYVAQIDPKGKIPKTIETYVSQHRPMCILQIRNLLRDSSAMAKPKAEDDQWRGASPFSASKSRMNRASVYVPNTKVFGTSAANDSTNAHLAELLNTLHRKNIDENTNFGIDSTTTNKNTLNPDNMSHNAILNNNLNNNGGDDNNDPKTKKKSNSKLSINSNSNAYDTSPKNKKKDDSDASPKNKKKDDSDSSPKNKKKDNSDTSPKNKKNDNHANSDTSPKNKKSDNHANHDTIKTPRTMRTESKLSISADNIKNNADNNDTKKGNSKLTTSNDSIDTMRPKKNNSKYSLYDTLDKNNPLTASSNHPESSSDTKSNKVGTDTTDSPDSPRPSTPRDNHATDNKDDDGKALLSTQKPGSPLLSPKSKRASKLNLFSSDKKTKPQSGSSSPTEETKGGLWHRAQKHFQAVQKHFLDQ